MDSITILTFKIDLLSKMVDKADGTTTGKEHFS